MLQLPPALRFLQRDWLNANHILFIDNETTLVDTGYGSCIEETLTRLRHPDALGARRLDRIVNTHAHSDHIGGNARLRREYGCTITLPAGEAHNIETWNTRELWLDYADQEVERFSFDAVVNPGDTIAMGGMEWRAIAAPGHDRGALVFHNASHRLLITGDALWENGFGIILPGPGAEHRLAETRATLEALAPLDVAIVLPGHGRAFAEFRPALERAFARLAAFEADPMRMARSCIRAILAFSLLQHGGIPLAEVPAYLASVPMHKEINAEYFRLSATDYAEMLLIDLEKAGAARRDNGMLLPT